VVGGTELAVVDFQGKLLVYPSCRFPWRGEPCSAPNPDHRRVPPKAIAGGRLDLSLVRNVPLNRWRNSSEEVALASIGQSLNQKVGVGKVPS